MWRNNWIWASIQTLVNFTLELENIRRLHQTTWTWMFLGPFFRMSCPAVLMETLDDRLSFSDVSRKAVWDYGVFLLSLMFFTRTKKALEISNYPPFKFIKRSNQSNNNNNAQIFSTFVPLSDPRQRNLTALSVNTAANELSLKSHPDLHPIENAATAQSFFFYCSETKLWLSFQPDFSFYFVWYLLFFVRSVWYGG